MAENRAKVGLKFGYGGRDHTVIKIEDGHSDDYYNIVITEGDWGYRTTWSQKGLETWLETYPGFIIE